MINNIKKCPDNYNCKGQNSHPLQKKFSKLLFSYFSFFRFYPDILRQNLDFTIIFHFGLVLVFYFTHL